MQYVTFGKAQAFGFPALHEPPFDVWTPFLHFEHKPDRCDCGYSTLSNFFLYLLEQEGLLFLPPVEDSVEPPPPFFFLCGFFNGFGTLKKSHIGWSQQVFQFWKSGTGFQQFHFGGLRQRFEFVNQTGPPIC